MDIQAVVDFERLAIGGKAEEIQVSKVANMTLVQEAERELREKTGKP